MDAAGGNLRQLTDNDAGDSTPAWSPNGKKIAFESFRGPDPEIFKMDADGSDENNVTKNDFDDDFDPAWSPNGDEIAFASQTADSLEIFKMDADGSDQDKLTKNDDTDRDPDWQPEP